MSVWKCALFLKMQIDFFGSCNIRQTAYVRCKLRSGSFGERNDSHESLVERSKKNEGTIKRKFDAVDAQHGVLKRQVEIIIVLGAWKPTKRRDNNWLDNHV